jgi:hypothetical protein
MGNHSFADRRFLDFAQLEDEGRGNVALFDPRLANVELTRLAVMIGKAFRP